MGLQGPLVFHPAGLEVEWVTSDPTGEMSHEEGHLWGAWSYPSSFFYSTILSYLIGSWTYCRMCPHVPYVQILDPLAPSPLH